jgi:hypothetical protein
MATELQINWTARIAWEYLNKLDFADATDEGSIALTDSLANGTSADQANAFWRDQRTLASASETHDLTSLTDSLGLSLTFTGIKGIFIWNTTTTALADLSVGGATTNIFSGFLADSSDIVVVPPNGQFIWWSPGAAATVDDTHKNLKLNSPAATVVYDIVLIGTKA